MVARDEILAQRPDLGPVIAPADALFPVKVTRSFWDRIDAADPADPLARQVLPDAAELAEDPFDLADPVGDAACSPVPWVVHKYPDRVLWMLTKRCHLYCRYCFRRNHEPGGLDPSEAEWAGAVEYLRGVAPREVILSGGDPLAVRDKRLFQAIDAARAVARVVRIHTRAPITFPERITEEFAGALAERSPLYVVVHANHARELSSEVAVALGRMVDAGVPVLNQAVLLRGVNDSVDALAALFEGLVELRVKPYYLHHPDRAAGNAHFRVPIEEGQELMRGVRERVGGLALPVYVLDAPDGSGKRPIPY